MRRQEQDCRDLCDREGWQIVDVFTDDDRSAYHGKPRTGFGQLRQLLASNGADVLVAWHPDRLTRQPRELEDLIDLLESTKTTVRTVQTGEYDLTTPSGRMAARIVGAVARHESEHKSARIRRKHLELAEAGHQAGGGDRPFGYEDDRATVRKAEAKVIRDITKRVLAGEALGSICRDLNARGVFTVQGRRWHPSALRRILTSARIAGLRSHRGVVTSKAVWPGIIAEDDHRRLVAILTDPARRTSHGREPKLLTGLLECSNCGRKMVSRPRSNSRPGGGPIAAYICAKGLGHTGCGQISTLGEPVDELVTEAVLTRLDSPDLERHLRRDNDNGDALDELGEVETRLAELGQLWASGDLDAVGWRAARETLERKQREITDRLRVTARQDAVTALGGGSVRKLWPKLSTGQRRAVLTAVIDAVIIGPVVRGRNRFDPDRVSIRWGA